MKTLLFCAGGTLGHIKPAISLIKTLKKQKQVRIIFFTTIKDEKYEVLKDCDIDKTYYFDCVGIPKDKLQIFKSIYKNLLAIKKLKSIIKKEKVDLIVGMGGFISGLTILSSNIKAVVCEQNSVLGFGNKIVKRKVECIFTSFKNTKGLNTKKELFIGNPVLLFKKYNSCINHNILITSGSVGSKIMNEVAILLINEKKYKTILITGEKYYEDVLKKAKESYKSRIIPFSNELEKDIVQSEIVISRGGASTLFELLNLKKVSIIIPSPNVTKNHQFYNAKEFEKLGLIYLLEEKDLTIESLNEAIQYVYKHYDEYKMRLETFSSVETNQLFVEKIYEIMKG